MATIETLFTVQYGNGLALSQLHQCPKRGNDCVSFVSRTSENNGVSAYVQKLDGTKPFEAGLITVAGSGNTMEATIQEYPFYTSYHIFILAPKKPMSFAEKLYYCLCIRKNRYRFSYGRQANRTIRTIELPDSIPGWVNNVNIEGELANVVTAVEEILPEIDSINWQPFTYEQLFNIQKGERIVNADMEKGQTPCVRPIQSNNGVVGKIKHEPNHEGNVITVNYNGSVAEAFYQPEPIFALDDVNVLYPKFKLTPEIGLFLVTLIRKERYRFNYGRKWKLERMKETTIRLPADENGDPDWDFMQRYIESLPFASKLNKETGTS